MQDQPKAVDLIAAVADFLRHQAMPELTGHTAFHARVAANALDIVRRELEAAPAADAAEHERLKALMGGDGSLDALNRALSAAIAAGEMTLETPGLADHLWATTLAKLSIDQPAYASYRQEMQQGETHGFRHSQGDQGLPDRA